MAWLWVGVGGAIGAIARYGISLAVAHGVGGSFPYGTLIVNVIGSFVLGFLLLYAPGAAGMDQQLRLFFGTGMMGALTTFSTFSVETLQLVQAARYGLAGLNVFLNVTAGLSAAWLGSVIGRAA